MCIYIYINIEYDLLVHPISDKGISLYVHPISSLRSTERLCWQSEVGWDCLQGEDLESQPQGEPRNNWPWGFSGCQSSWFNHSFLWMFSSIQWWFNQQTMEMWVWVNTYRYIISGMNIHLPAILGFTRYQGFDPSPCSASWSREFHPHQWLWWLVHNQVMAWPAWLLGGGLSGMVGRTHVGQVLSNVPSGKLSHNYGKSPFLMGKLTINGHVQ